MTKEIIHHLKRKREMFRAGDTEGMKVVGEELKITRAQAKEEYRAKLDNCLQEKKKKT